MDTSQLLLDLYGRIPPLAGDVLSGLGPDQLCQAPEPGANTIGWLVWHTARVQDHHLSELQDAEQVWSGGDWARRCGLDPDPANTGYGHGPEEVAAVRPESVDVLLGYLGAVDTRTRGYLETLSPDDLDGVVGEVGFTVGLLGRHPVAQKHIDVPVLQGRENDGNRQIHRCRRIAESRENLGRDGGNRRHVREADHAEANIAALRRLCGCADTRHRGQEYTDE